MQFLFLWKSAQIFTLRHTPLSEGVVIKNSREQLARVVVEFKSVGRKTLVLEHARLTRVR